MKKIKRFFRRWWWAFLAGAGVVLGVVIAILVPRKKNQLSSATVRLPQPTFTEMAKVEVERVRLEGEIEKARIQATADAQQTALDDIEVIGATDPAEGRRVLARWLAERL